MIRHYRAEDGIDCYEQGDVLVNDTTGERCKVVRDARGICLVRQPPERIAPPWRQVRSAISDLLNAIDHAKDYGWREERAVEWLNSLEKRVEELAREMDRHEAADREDR
jgi:hypothetical protein